MAVEIITGHTGKEHVTAEAAGALQEMSSLVCVQLIRTRTATL